MLTKIKNLKGVNNTVLKLIENDLEIQSKIHDSCCSPCGTKMTFKSLLEWELLGLLECSPESDPQHEQYIKNRMFLVLCIIDAVF